MSRAHVDFLLNEEKISIKDLDTNTTVLNYLRNNHELTGTKEGCASGDCGACTAVVGELKENKISCVSSRRKHNTVFRRKFLMENITNTS